ncbi:MAG: NUDIX hydrolase [Cytophagales bacterium]|nr:NUDIX hydrolase [Cytophagales bacterium]
MTEALPASTIMLCRDHEGELQVLLLRRSKKLNFAGGFWVFPGGKVENSETERGKDDLDAAKIAAVRETKEETSVDIFADDLFFFRHWTTPKAEPRRFATWFFFGALPDHAPEVIIDDQEIKQHLWIHPQAAIDELKAGKLAMMPPTIMSLQLISKCNSVNEAKQAMNELKPVFVLPVIDQKESAFICMYEGDAGYGTADARVIGARHRLVLNAKRGEVSFEYEGCDDIHPVNEGMSF